MVTFTGPDGATITIQGAELAPVNQRLFTGRRTITGTVKIAPEDAAQLHRWMASARRQQYRKWYSACRSIRRRDGSTTFRANFGAAVFRIGYETYPNGIGCDFGSVPTMKMARAALAQHLEQPWRVKGPQYRRLVIKEIRKLRQDAQLCAWKSD